MIGRDDGISIRAELQTGNISWCILLLQIHAVSSISIRVRSDLIWRLVMGRGRHDGKEQWFAIVRATHANFYQKCADDCSPPKTCNPDLKEWCKCFLASRLVLTATSAQNFEHPSETENHVIICAINLARNLFIVSKQPSAFLSSLYFDWLNRRFEETRQPTHIV